ncbi:MAG: glycosyltransferase family 4 protein [Gemmatimonadaceae bacterium]|nr:glycosyltransferase family 4 protein [Gemmatimonadaceae bacterium]
MEGGESALRIAMVLPSLDIGGEEFAVLRLAKSLAERNHRVHIVCTDHLGELASEVSSVNGISLAVAKTRGWRDVVFPSALLAELDAFHPQVVHSHTGSWFQCAACRSVRRSFVLVHTEHGMISRPEPLKLAILKRLARERTDSLSAVSESLRLELSRQLRIGSDSICTIPNGIDVAQFQASAHRRSQAREQLAATADEIVVGCVARLHPLKGIDVLLDAWAALKTESRSRLVVIGDGQEREVLRERARRLNVPVNFMGSRSDVALLMSGLDVFVLPSRSEGLPLALLEAMATGLPCVVTDVGEMSAVLGGGDYGLVVPPERPAELAAAIGLLLANPTRRASYAEGVRERVESLYGHDRTVAHYVSTYRRLLQS